jgi:hypothetical protein
LERRIDQMGAIDLGDLVRRRQARAGIHDRHRGTMRDRRAAAKSILIAADCKR